MLPNWFPWQLLFIWISQVSCCAWHLFVFVWAGYLKKKKVDRFGQNLVDRLGVIRNNRFDFGENVGQVMTTLAGWDGSAVPDPEPAYQWDTKQTVQPDGGYALDRVARVIVVPTFLPKVEAWFPADKETRSQIVCLQAKLTPTAYLLPPTPWGLNKLFFTNLYSEPALTVQETLLIQDGDFSH